MKAFIYLLLIPTLFWVKSQAQETLPMATIEPTSAVRAAGENITLTCGTARATSNTRWMRNNVPIAMDARHVISEAESTLTVIGFSEELAGNYTCVASNDVGVVSSSNARLQLEVLEVNFFSQDMDSPHQVTVTAGQPTAIDCGSFNAFPATKLNLNWEVQFGSTFERVSISNERATVGLNQSLYLLDPSRDLHNGAIFSCTARTASGSGYVQIAIQDPTPDTPTPDPHIVVRPQDITTWVGQTISFECIPGGRNVASRTAIWEPPVAGVRIAADTFRLSISPVRAANAGVYTCTIEGIGTFAATLNLIEPPVLESLLPASPTSLVYGDTLSLSCSSSPSPHATNWEWFLNGTRLPSETSPSLRVGSTTLDNSGTYQCIVYNAAGYNQSASQVQITTIAASITATLPAGKLVFRDHALSLSCSAGGAPPPTYTWFKNNDPLQTGAAFEVNADEGGLRFLTVDGLSDGVYMCQAVNSLPDNTEIGRDHTSTQITTIGPTEIQRELGPIFSVQVGTRTVFPCEVTHGEDALITYSWLRNSEDFDIAANSHVRFESPQSSGTIVINPVRSDDAGTYQCIVSTQRGGLQAPDVIGTETVVSITNNPVGPVILSINSSSPNSVQVQWFFPGTPIFVTYYIIQIQSLPESGSPWVSLQNRSVNAVTDADISSEMLMAFTKYNVRVVAIYADGNSAPSESVMVQTGVAVPADSPVGLVGKAPLNTALSLSWMPPSTPRGEIIDYVIQYKVKGEAVATTVSTGSGDTGYVLTPLPRFKKFEIRIAAVTSAGQGPFTPWVEAITVQDGSLTEQEGGPFIESIQFIVLLVALVLLGVVGVVVAMLVVRHKVKGKAVRRYHVRHSGYFGKNVDVIGMESTNGDSPDMGDDVIATYTGRNKRAFSTTSTTEMPLSTLEGGSSFGGTSTPQLSMGSGSRLLHAPSYIDPPSFEETVMKTSRSQSATSAPYHRDFEAEWKRNVTEGYMNNIDEQVNEQGYTSNVNGEGYTTADLDFKHPSTEFNPNSIECEYDDSDIEKNPLETGSEGTEQNSENTQYSHLAGAQPVDPSTAPVYPSTAPPVFHHQLNLPLSASSSGGVPMSVGEMVHNRLHAQSAEEESPLNYATYV